MTAGLLAAAAMALAAGLAGGFLQDWWRTRGGLAFGGGLAATAAANAASLLGGGPRLAFSAVSGWPWPAPWAWPLALAGLAPLARRWPAALWVGFVGLLPLALSGSGSEPHRLALAQVALALAAGSGAAWMLARPLWRLLPLLLLCGGMATELNAFLSRDPAAYRASYGRSQDLAAAAHWLQDRAPAEGWDVIDGLGPFDDRPFRDLLAARGVRRNGGRAVALVPVDYLPAVAGSMPVQGITAGGSAGVLLAFPSARQSLRLRGVQAAVAGLDLDAYRVAPARFALDCAAWLRQRGHDDPWARTIAWELWLRASLRSQQVDPGGLEAMLAEPLVSGWGPDVMADALHAAQPALAGRCAAKALASDGRRKAWTLDQRLERY